jgi:hypothetical protein
MWPFESAAQALTLNSVADHGFPTNNTTGGPFWPFESSKAISGAINVLNNYPTVTTLDTGKFWHMLWQYTASHTPEWKLYQGSQNNLPVFVKNVSNSSFEWCSVVCPFFC